MVQFRTRKDGRVFPIARVKATKYLRDMDKLNGVITPRFLDHAKERIEQSVKNNWYVARDKHGIPIWEGDIVKDKSGRIFRVHMITLVPEGVHPTADFEDKVLTKDVEVIKLTGAP